MWVAEVRSALLCASLVLAAGCPMTNKAATDSYARQVSVATMRVATLEAEVSANEQRVGQIEEAMRAQGAEQVTRLETIEEVNTEVGRIRGDIEVLRFDVTEVKKMLDDLLIEQDRRMIYLETRIAQLESFLGVQPPPPPTPEELGMVTPGGKTIVAEDGTIVLLPDGDGELDTNEPSVAVAEVEIPDTAEGKLELAVSHMEAGRNGVARAILQKAAAEHAGSAKMDEIRYRLAETYFNEGDWRKAISEFNGVIEGWPKSPWASWAMLAQGDAFSEWGQADNAKLFYEEVVRVYPKSEAAKEARKLLAQ